MTKYQRGCVNSRIVAATLVTPVFNTSRQVSKLGQADTALSCLLRNWIYKLTPSWLAEEQFRWLFDYQSECREISNE